jgi:tetratricopeptide (TPR) repeat protein
MKRTQRHQLKENELAQTLAAARAAVEARQGQIAKAAVAVVVVILAVLAINWFRGRGEASAEQALAQAMVVLNAPVVPPTATPEAGSDLPAAASLAAEGSYPSEAAKLTAALPRLQTAAADHPGTVAGTTARYHYASALSALGRHDEAIQAYDQVIGDAGADSLYGRMAQLGKADTQKKAGQLDAAIATWQALASSNDEDLPQDAILAELARAYQARGQEDEAKKTLTQLVEQHPTSPYSAQARAELGS